MSAPPPSSTLPDVPSVNEVRLNGKLWCIALAIIALALLAMPRIWKWVERFEITADYRVPYSLSRDYWLYERRLEHIKNPDPVVVLGDSVIWGEYVLPDGTLTHFLNAQSGQGERFVNGGVNGLFPLAMEGLIDHYAEALRNRKVILHCNLLWMSSPKADLNVQKEEKFNHSRLVPQFSPRIPCYKANANERLSVVVERNVQFISWVTHLQSAYFNDRSIPAWTLEDDGNDPPAYPNAYRNPLRQITMQVPSAPANDPLRGPSSERHKAWNQSGGTPAQFEWVELDSSLQWTAFKRALQKLRARGNDVLVLFGPFNEQMIAEESRDGFQKLRDGAFRWFNDQRIDYLAPETLPPDLYADASHPLTSGYQLLAEKISANPAFKNWMQAKRP
jgi:hypothetical protein